MESHRYRFEGNTYPARARLRRKGWQWHTRERIWTRFVEGTFPARVTGAFLEKHYPGCRLSTLEGETWQVVWTSKTYLDERQAKRQRRQPDRHIPF